MSTPKASAPIESTVPGNKADLSSWCAADWIVQQTTSAAWPTPTMDWLKPIQHQGIERFSQLGWPTRKTEAWKYSPITQALRPGLLTAAIDAPITEPELPGLPKIDAVRIVFINGQLITALSDLSDLPAGLQWVSYSDANPEQQRFIQAALTEPMRAEHALTALNRAQLTDGWLLDVAANQRLVKPIYLIHYRDVSQSRYSHQHYCVRVQQGAEATLIEHSLSASHCEAVFHHAEVQLYVESNASLKHYLVQLDQGAQVSVGSWNLVLNRYARLNSFILGLGSRLKRIDYNVAHRGEGAESSLDAVYLPKGKQHIDVHTQFDHEVPHSQSQQRVRGIVNGQAKAVFNGRIHIHPGAQKTLAELSNKNLLLSDQAEINTKPELEIYADDVRCAHGATISQLDHQGLGYLRARGISKPEAEMMLSVGFIQALIQELPIAQLSGYLTEQVALWFEKDESLMRHVGSTDSVNHLS